MDCLFNFQVDDLLSSVEKIDIEVRSLETCSYNSQTFRDVLGKVQRAVDELNLHSYSNLPQWVATLDLQVKGVIRSMDMYRGIFVYNIFSLG